MLNFGIMKNKEPPRHCVPASGKDTCKRTGVLSIHRHGVSVQAAAPLSQNALYWLLAEGEIRPQFTPLVTELNCHFLLLCAWAHSCSPARWFWRTCSVPGLPGASLSTALAQTAVRAVKSHFLHSQRTLRDPQTLNQIRFHYFPCIGQDVGFFKKKYFKWLTFILKR